MSRARTSVALAAILAASVPPGAGGPSLMPGLPSSPDLLRERDVERARRAATAIPKAEAKRERRRQRNRKLLLGERESGVKP